MEKITDRKQVNKITIIFAAAYMVSYLTRINFAAIIAEMVRDTVLPKSLLSMALTGSFVTYAAGQVVSGVCGDKIRPKLLVFYGLLATSAMNFLIPFCKSPLQMTIVWCINGFAQAFMWPPMVRMMAEIFNADDYSKSCIIVSWGCTVGTILVYLISPLIILSAGWRSVFVCSAATGIIMAVVWHKLCIDVETAKLAKESGAGEKNASILNPVFLAIIFVVIFHGAVRDGITTWLPSYLTETYKISSHSSILSGIVLPIFSIICVHIASAVYKQAFKSPIACAGLFFGLGAVFAAMLGIFEGANATASVLFSALAAGSMHGVNLMLISIMPRFFNKYGKVSTVSGLLNACTYGGSAISTYGIAIIAENAGWNSAIMLYTLLSVIGTIICFLSVSPWRKRYNIK